MIKNIIAPVQAWLLAQGKCVGCGKKLPKKAGGNGLIRVACSCGRIYMYDSVAGSFRRARLDEVS